MRSAHRTILIAAVSFGTAGGDLFVAHFRRVCQLIYLLTGVDLRLADLAVGVAGVALRCAGRVFFASQLGGMAQFGDACAGLDCRFAVEAVGVAGVADEQVAFFLLRTSVCLCPVASL